MIKPKSGNRIEKLYAWCAVDDDGDEGIIAGMLPGMPGFTPLVGADRARMESYRPWAEDTAWRTKRVVMLKVFDKGVEIDRVEPKRAT